MVSYFSFLILIGNGNSFFVNNTVEVGNYFFRITYIFVFFFYIEPRTMQIRLDFRRC